MQAVTVPTPVVMEFHLSTTYTTTRHYTLTQGCDLYTQQINLSINRGYSKALYTYSLRVRQNGKWSPQITGLFATQDPNIYYGDTENKKNLLIVRFFAHGTRLRLYHFSGFYTRRTTDFLKAFKEVF